MKEIKETETKIGKLHVSEYSFAGMTTRLVVQENDGTILFDGDYSQAKNLKDVLIKVFEETETFSNCCGVGMDRDESHCPSCHEGCAVVDQNDKEVE